MKARNAEEILLKIIEDRSDTERTLKRIQSAYDRFKSKANLAARAGRLLAVVFGCIRETTEDDSNHGEQSSC